MKHRRRVWASTVLAVVALLCAGSTLKLAAQQPKQNTSPAAQGYLVEFSKDWVASDGGFLPVRVSITSNSTGVSSSDERFTITIASSDPRDPGIRTSAPLVIPAGRKSAHTDLYLDHRTVGFRNLDLLIEVGVGDGEFQERSDLLATNFTTTTNQYQWNSALLLLVSSSFTGRESQLWQVGNGKAQSRGVTQLGGGDGAPDLREYVNTFFSNKAASGQMMSRWAPVKPNGGWNFGCRPSDLPDSWIGLTSVEVMLISMEDLTAVSEEHPAKRQAIQKWTSAGGTLVVFDMDSKYEQANKIAPMLLGNENESGPPSDRLWKEPSLDLLGLKKLINLNDEQGSRYFDIDEDVYFQAGDIPVAGELWIEHQSLDDLSTSPKLLITTHVSGQIVAIKDDMQGWKTQDWRGLVNSLKLDARSLRQRIGPRNFHDSLGGFRVPGVGEPPVMAFQILIGLFVVVAGPVMYVVLRRTKRMQLLFVLVPLLSLAACFGLLSYAILVDGFESWGNVQSVTHLEQQTNSAVTHARAAYYSGRQPSPYEYSTDTLAIVPTDELNREPQTFQKPDVHVFSGGNFRARTPHQLVTVRSYQTDLALVWQVAKNAGTPSRENSGEDCKENSNDKPNVRVRNRLGGKVVFAVANIGSEFYVISDLADGDQGQARTDEAANIRKAAGKLVPDLARENIHRYGYDYLGNDRGDESHYLDLIYQHSQGGVTRLLEELNTYVAFVEEFPEVENQIEPANYKKQLHVIIGKW